MKTEKRYFIYDCKGNVCGNPKGYRTYVGAERETNKVGGKVFNHIWNLFNIVSDEMDTQGVPASGRLIHEIKLEQV